jgi:hypothetical protein
LNGFGRIKGICMSCTSFSNKFIFIANLSVDPIQKYRLHLRKSTQILHKDDAASSSSHQHESNNLETQLLFRHSPNSVYLDQEMDTWGSRSTISPKDHLSSGFDCMLVGERNNYSPEGFPDFRWVSDKQACDSDAYLWNFEAE